MRYEYLFWFMAAILAISSRQDVSRGGGESDRGGNVETETSGTKKIGANAARTGPVRVLGIWRLPALIRLLIRHYRT